VAPVADEVADRVHELLDRSESRIRRRYVDLVRWLREHNDLAAVTAALEAGHTDDAITMIDAAARALAAEVTQVYTLAAQDEAQVASLELRTRVVYDQVNERAVAAARANALEMVREVTQEQRDVLRQVIAEGVRDGLNPLSVARDLRASIGLTRKQLEYVDNYRRELERGDLAALNRALRDARHDRSVTAAANGRAIPQSTIDLMVDRYRQRWINYRAEVIGRTEGLRAAHTGMMATWQQIIDDGRIQATDLYRTWLVTLPRGKNPRDFHTDMHGQEVPWGQPFVSGLGNQLEYPGDPSAPAEETVQCRCAQTVRVRQRTQVQVPADVAPESRGFPASSRDVRVPRGEDFATFDGVDPDQLAGRLYGLPTGMQEERIATQERLFREGRTPGPIKVVMDPDGDMEIVDGRHRFLAAQRLGRPIDVRVDTTHRDLTPQIDQGILVPVTAEGARP